MASSSVRIFRDSDDYAATVRAAQLEVTPIVRGPFDARLVRVDLHRMWLQSFQESLPNLMRVSMNPGRSIFMLLDSPQQAQVWNSAEMAGDRMIRHVEGDQFYLRSTAANGRRTFSLPVETAASLMADSGVREPETRAGRPSQQVRPPAAALRRLRDLHATTCDLAEVSPHVLADPGSADGLEHALVEAWLACMSGADDPRDDRAARRGHDAIMRNFRRICDAHADRPLHMVDLCRATGLPERTLRLWCNDYLGMGPKRYQTLRRMYQAHNALLTEAPDVGRVTEVAARFGFWHFGRFAVAYRRLFGESPSRTLQKTPDDRPEGRALPKLDSADPVRIDNRD